MFYALSFYYGGCAIFFLRVALGALFIVHGWPKLKNLDAAAKSFDGMGFKPGRFFGTFAGLLEFIGGIAIVIGFLVSPIAVIFAVEFLVILIWRFSKNMPFVGGWELDLIIFAALIVLIVFGAGSYALTFSLNY